MKKVTLGRSVLYGEVISPLIITEEWKTAGWYDLPTSGYYGHYEFRLEGGAIIDLPVNEQGRIDWSIEEVEE